MSDTGYLHWNDFAADDLLALARFATVRNRSKFVPTTVTTNEAGHRKSNVLWHYEYADLYAAFSARLLSFMPDIRRVFPQVPETPDIEMQLTSHTTGEYFKRHLDNASEDTKLREVTYVFYYTLEDEQRFTGGELILETYAGTYTIQPKHNTIIMFPSGCWHEVRPVDVPSNRWEDSRMTLNGWLRRSP